MVEWKKLGEICTNLDYMRKPITSSKRIAGIYPYFGASGIVDYVETYLFEGDYLLVSEDGANLLARTTPIAFSIKGKNWVNNHAHVLKFDHKSTQEYVEAFLNKIDLSPWINGAAQPKLNQANLSSIEIPLPSLEEQKRIVGILDTFTDSIENLKQQIAQRRKQYEHYRDQLLDLEGKEGVEMTPLKDVAEIGTGSSNTNEGLKEGKYPFYTRGKEVLWKNEYEFDDTSIITAGDGVGVGKVFHFVSGKYALHQRAYRIHIKSNNIIPRFIYYFMVSTFETYIRMKSFFAAVSSVRKPMIYNYPIPKCPLSEQQRIVSILDTFEASISNLEAQLEQRQKQYEYYRNKLLSFEKEE